MKKLLLMLSLTLATLSCHAAVQMFGGFQDTTGANKTTIAKAVKMPDDTYVTLQGNIEKQLGEDKYLFKDTTGTITIEIDKHKWAGQVVNPKDKVEISGEIDKKFNYIKLDVNTIKKLSK